ncbi:MAG: extracellular solute-binding protein [Burkholderiaceae bacterium]
MNHRHVTRRAALIALFLSVWLPAFAQLQDKGKVFRLLTWNDFTPTEVIAEFEKETGYKVQVTVASNDDMITKLRATTGDAFDLAQPSQERIVAAQKDHRIYRPLDLAKIKVDLFNPVLLEATKKVTTVDGMVYGLPHIWGTDGLVINSKLAKNIADYPDLCKKESKNKTSVKLWRPTLLAFAFATGKDPFALYSDPKAYSALMDDVAKTLATCKSNMKFHWDNKDRVLGAMRTEELQAAMVWDRGGWTLNSERPEFRYIAPRSGAMGWVDTFALPARSRNEDIAYAWINFNLRPEIAAKLAKSTSNLTAVKGSEAGSDEKRQAQFATTFPLPALKQIKWYPAFPPALEDIENRALERIRLGDPAGLLTK